MNFVRLLKRKTLEKRVQQSFLAARETVFHCNEEIHIALIHVYESNVYFFNMYVNNVIHIHIVYYLCSHLSMCNV